MINRIIYAMGTPLIFVVLVALLTLIDLYQNVLHMAKFVRDGWRTL